LSEQSAARRGKKRPNPTDRGKPGTKKSLLVDAEGGPLGVTIEGAKVHDSKLLKETLEAVVVGRPEASEETPQNLCLDKGYDIRLAAQPPSWRVKFHISDGLGRRSWTQTGGNVIRLVGGWSNELLGENWTGQ
jgi:hypothetical protein